MAQEYTYTFDAMTLRFPLMESQSTNKEYPYLHTIWSHSYRDIIFITNLDCKSVKFKSWIERSIWISRGYYTDRLKKYVLTQNKEKEKKMLNIIDILATVAHQTKDI